MNQTKRTVKSYLTDSQVSKSSFRVLVKNRTTHQVLNPDNQKPQSQYQSMNNTIEQEGFESVKNNLKKYIRTMKGSLKLPNSQTKINTNRSSSQLSQSHSRITSSRSRIQSFNQGNKSVRSSFLLKNQKPLLGITQKLSTENYGSYDLSRKPSVRYNTQHQVQSQGTKLPALKPAYETKEQSSIGGDQFISSQNAETFERQRIQELENRIEFLLEERMKMLSTSNSFSSNQQVKNKTAYKLLEKQMDKVLEQIRKMKETQDYSCDGIVAQNIQKDVDINKNIQMLQKKVKIIEKLIAEKLFQSDNLKSQYLQKLKKHRKYVQDKDLSKRSKSSTFYREANTLNSKFKPSPYEKKPICQNDRTTNRAAYKIPLKSYYVKPQKNHSYDPNKLNQPLPRSTYNCQYLTYGQIPKELIELESGHPNHRIFSNSLSEENQKRILRSSTYKVDFEKKIDKEPVNFKQLDCYKDKFKNLQVNYGKDRNDVKVVNSKSVIQFYQQDKDKTPGKNIQQLSNEIGFNPQKLSNGSFKIPNKKSETFKKVQELNRSIGQLKQTQTKVSMIEQQQLQRNNLFHQRIKSEIKHKNIYDQKYQFRKDLIKERIRKIEGLNKTEKHFNSLTLEY